MTQQVLYSTVTSQVLQWQDTSMFNYPIPSSTNSVIEVTEEEWSNQSGTWYVVNGSLTQTNPNAPTAEQLLENAITTQTNLLNQDCFNFITKNGLPVEINGTLYMIGASQIDQNNLNTMSATNLGIANSPEWTADTVVDAGTTMILNDNYIITKTGGTTDSTAPTVPTEFQTPVTDGNVTWYLYGNYVALSGGGAMWITLQQFKAAYAQGVSYLTDMRAEYHVLVDSLVNKSTVADVQAVVWPFTTVEDAISYVGFGTTSSASTSSETASS